MNAVSKTSTTEPVTFLSVIARAASDPTVDMDKMERLLAMQERMSHAQAEAEFNQALSSCQSETGRVSADATNPQTRSRYATYEKLDKVLRPIYTSHGFALTFSTTDSPKEDHIRVICKVRHRAGHVDVYQIDMPADGKGAKGGDVMTKTHAAGAAMSYGMRYLLKAIFNVAIGEEDKDGNDSTLPVISEEQAADLNALLEETGSDKVLFMKWAKVSSLGQILTRNYEFVCKEVRARASQRAAK